MSANCDQINCHSLAVGKGKCPCHLRIVCMFPSCLKLKGLRGIYCGDHHRSMKKAVYVCFRNTRSNGVLLCEKHMMFALREKKSKVHAFSDGKGIGQCVVCKLNA